MEIANRPSIRRKTVRRIWKTPGSKFNWFFLASSLFVLGWVFLVYRSAVATQPYPGPYNDPFRQFGIVAFVLVLLVAGYTMRRRFMRNLPGKVQDWLWLHIWFGVISVLIAFMHNNFQGITHDFSFLARRFTEAAYGTTALYALLALVLTGPPFYRSCLRHNSPLRFARACSHRNHRPFARSLAGASNRCRS